MSAPLPPAYRQHYGRLKRAARVATVVLALLGLWTLLSLFAALHRIFSH